MKLESLRERLNVTEDDRTKLIEAFEVIYNHCDPRPCYCEITKVRCPLYNTCYGDDCICLGEIAESALENLRGYKP